MKAGVGWAMGLWRSNLLLHTVSVVGLVVVVVGVGLTYVLVGVIEGKVQREAIRNTETLRPRVLKLVGPQDLAQPLAGARYEEVNQMIRDHIAGPDIVRFKLWNTAGTVVYSTFPSQIGDSYPENEGLIQALQGSMAWEVTRLPESPQELRLGELLEVYVPLAWQPGESPVGAMEVYLPYAPYARLVSAIRWSIFLAVALASLTLPAALFLLYRTSSASLRRERDVAVQRQREVAALNRLLQQDLSHYFELRDRLLNLRAQVMQDPRFQPDATPISARDAWLLMELREVAAFSENIMASEQQQPKGEAS